MTHADPFRPFTQRQEQVIAGICRGLEYGEIARLLRRSPRTIEAHVTAIMHRLPNPDDLDPYLCIFLWARHRQWLLTEGQTDRKKKAG